MSRVASGRAHGNRMGLKAWPGAILVALLLALMLPPAAMARQDGHRVPNRYIVVLEDSVAHPGRVAERHAENRDANIHLVYRAAIEGYAATIAPAELAAVRQDPNVAYIEPDYRGGIASQTIPTGIDRIFATGNATLDIDEKDDQRIDVDVAVLDTAIDASHPDLDVVGQVNCHGGEPPVCEEEESEGGEHGTHVAGTIAAIDNGIGVVGVAPGARLWSIKVLNGAGFGELSEFIAGIDWVTAAREDEDPENDIEVTNASLSYEPVTSSKAFGEALEASIGAGVVHVAAAGNDSETVKYVPGNNPEEITVSAIEDLDGLSTGEFEGKDSLATFSNFGTPVDIAAPGVAIFSTRPLNGYKFLSGTSMASPHVAGAAAVLAAEDNPESAGDVDAIRDELVEAGNLDWIDTSKDGAQEPLLAMGADPLLGPDTTTGAATEVTDTTAILNATVNPEGLETTYQFEYGTTTAYGSKAPASPEEIGEGTEAVEVDEPIEGLEPETTYHFRIVATNEEGISHGKDLEFTTGGPPSATTKAATRRTSEGATLNALVDANGLASFYQFEYGKTTAYGTKVPAVPKYSSETTSVEVSEPIGGLEPGTTYHFRVVASNAADTDYGEDLEFTTQPEPAVASHLSSFGSFGEAAGELEYPSDVAIDSDGNLWVLETNSCRVQKFNQKGEYLDGFDEPGEVQCFSIAVDAEGSIWVASIEGEIMQFDSDGELLNTISGGMLAAPMGLEFDSDGNLWVAQTSGGEKPPIVKFDSEGEFLGGFGAESELITPSDVAIDPEGNIWVTEELVAEESAPRVHKLDPEGEYVFGFGTYGTGPGEFGYPAGIAIDPEGDLWIADYAGQVEEFTSEGEFLGETLIGGVRGIEFGAEGEIWVAQVESHEVQQWIQPLPPSVATKAAAEVTGAEATLKASIDPNSLETTYQFEYGKTTSYGTKIPISEDSVGSGVTPVEVSEPIEGLEPNTTYHFRVVAANAEDVVFGPDQTFTTTIATEYEISAGADEPKGIALGLNNTLWFTEGGDEIGKITAQGKITEYEIPWSHPVGIALGPDGLMWYTGAYSDKDKLGKITAAGEVTEYALPSKSDPEAIVTGGDGNLWFTAPGTKKIGRMSSSGTILNEYAVSGAPKDIAADSQSNLWFTMPYANKIGKITSQGTLTEYEVPTKVSGPGNITRAGGKMWFTEEYVDKIASITASGTITEYSVSSDGTLSDITLGPDGNLWFTKWFTGPSEVPMIGKVTTEGTVTEYPLPEGSQTRGITSGPNGTIWFTNDGSRDTIGTFTP